MHETACPACGETEALRGRPHDGNIAVTCERCGAEWMRGAPRCRKCGRPDGVELPQRMTRHPRGTLLAVVGVREVPLCVECDAEVVGPALQHRRPIPEGYVSRFLYGEPSRDQRPTTAVRSKPAPRRSQERRQQVQQVVQIPSPAVRPEPQITDPTLRQATEEFLEAAGGGADSLTMVLLGSKLGPSTRLSALDTEKTALFLAAWVEGTFGGREDRRRQAVATLRQAVAYWSKRGWITQGLVDQIE
jgi:hypothetical protein